jgi:hypothetical protein
MNHEFSLRDADSATIEAMLATDTPEEEADDARTYADTARHDDPSNWLVGTEVEIYYEKLMPEHEGSPPTGRWHFEETIFVQVDQVQHPGYICVLNKHDGEADWVPLDQVRRRLVTPNRDSTGSELWRKARTAPSTEKQIGPDLHGGDLLSTRMYVPGKHQPWMCLARWYSRVSHNGQQLNKLLLAQFLYLIDDETTRETCRAASGGRFTEALVALFVVVGVNPGMQLVNALNETHLSYQGL